MSYENFINMDLLSEIEKLKSLQYWAKNTKHYKCDSNEKEPELWEATSFIYAFFIFNMMYNYNWKESIENKELFLHNFGQSEKSKIETLIDFIFEDKRYLYLNSLHKVYVDTIKDNLHDTEFKEGLQDIVPDSNISELNIKKFSSSIEVLLNYRMNKSDVVNILFFVYKIRNNIFHGVKNTVMMSENTQRDRLKVYTNILLATNDLLLKIVERKLTT